MTRDPTLKDDEAIHSHVRFLERRLTPSRLQHSLGVMRVMRELVPVYALDLKQATLAGLLHDTARDMPAKRLLSLAQQAGIPITHAEDAHPIYLHGPVGAYIVSSRLGDP